MKIIVNSFLRTIQILTDDYSVFDEEGWCPCSFSVKCDLRSTSVRGTVYKDDLISFLKTLELFNQGLTQSVAFNHIEEYFSVNGISTTQNEIEWSGTISSLYLDSGPYPFFLKTSSETCRELETSIRMIVKHEN